MNHDAWNFEKRGSVARIQPASKAALLNNWVDALALFRTCNSKGSLDILLQLYVEIVHAFVYLLSALRGEGKNISNVCCIFLSRDCQEPVS